MTRANPAAAICIAAALITAAACSHSNSGRTDSAAALGPAATDTTAPPAAGSSPAATPGSQAATGVSDNTGLTGNGSTPPASMTSGAATPTGMSDANILAAQYDGDSAEVAIATYMQKNATSSRVKSYADLLERDHSRGMTQVQALEKKLSIAPQTPPSDTAAAETAHEIAHLQSLNGADRDTAFVNHEIDDHKQDLAEAQDQAKQAQNPQVRALVDHALPELRKHLDRAQALAKK